MTIRNEVDDRRKFKRYTVRDGVFAALMPASKTLGQILDMGRGGLSFLYIYTDADDEDSRAVDIYVVGGEYYLAGLPVRIVSDVRVPNRIPVNPIIMRRRGVQFSDLTPEQADSLDDLIRRYAGGEIRTRNFR